MPWGKREEGVRQAEPTSTQPQAAAATWTVASSGGCHWRCPEGSEVDGSAARARLVPKLTMVHSFRD